MCVCVCASERARERNCERVSERARVGESVRAREREREREGGGGGSAPRGAVPIVAEAVEAGARDILEHDAHVGQLRADAVKLLGVLGF